MTEKNKKGLLIKSPWIDYILEGKKTWEIRSTKTKTRGRIALIKSGSERVFGSVEISDCIALSLDDYQQGLNKHAIAPEECRELPYKRTYAWALANPVIFDEPIPYKHPMGAVVWVNLERAI